MAKKKKSVKELREIRKDKQWITTAMKIVLPLAVIVLLVSGILNKPMDYLLLVEQRHPMYNSFFEKSRGIEFAPDPEQGEIGYAFRISKPWLSKLSAGDLNLLFNNVKRVYHGNYETVVLDCMDGTGIQFLDCETKEVVYGTLNEHGVVSEPEGYVQKKKGIYILTDMDGNAVSDAREKQGINGLAEQPDPAGGPMNQIKDLTVYLQALQDTKYTFYMVATDGAFGNLSWVQKEEFKWLGVPEDFLEGYEYSHALVSDQGNILVADTTKESNTFEGVTEGGSTYKIEHMLFSLMNFNGMNLYDDNTKLDVITIDGSKFYASSRGITFVVRDVEQGAVVDWVYFDTSRYTDKRIDCYRVDGSF